MCVYLERPRWGVRMIPLELQAPCESPNQDKFLKSQTEKTNWKFLKTYIWLCHGVAGTCRLVGEETVLINAEWDLVGLPKAQTAFDPAFHS